MLRFDALNFLICFHFSSSQPTWPVPCPAQLHETAGWDLKPAQEARKRKAPGESRWQRDSSARGSASAPRARCPPGQMCPESGHNHCQNETGKTSQRAYGHRQWVRGEESLPGPRFGKTGDEMDEEQQLRAAEPRLAAAQR